MQLKEKGVEDFDLFHKNYLVHNDKLWDRYRNGYVKVDELRWKRMWLTLLDFKIANEPLAREMGQHFLDLLPSRKALFPYTNELLNYLVEKRYQLHLISEGSNSLKPHKEIFEYAFQKTGAATDNCIMIGDTMDVDILGAMNAGIDSIHVNHLSNEKETINGKAPTHTVFSLKELIALF